MTAVSIFYVALENQAHRRFFMFLLVIKPSVKNIEKMSSKSFLDERSALLHHYFYACAISTETRGIAGVVKRGAVTVIVMLGVTMAK